MLRLRLLVVMLGGLCLLNASCASIVSGTTQRISVSSTPPGATLTLDNGQTYQLPAVFKISRKGAEGTVALAGYGSKNITFDSSLNGWFFGNLIFGGIPGFIIDALDGAMWKIDPDTVQVNLEARRPNP